MDLCPTAHPYTVPESQRHSDSPRTTDPPGPPTSSLPSDEAQKNLIPHPHPCRPSTSPNPSRRSVTLPLFPRDPCPRLGWRGTARYVGRDIGCTTTGVTDEPRDTRDHLTPKEEYPRTLPIPIASPPRRRPTPTSPDTSRTPLRHRPNSFRNLRTVPRGLFRTHPNRRHSKPFVVGKG